MIVNLSLENKKIIVIGGGKEAEKRINSLLDQKCKIVIISNSVSEKIRGLAKLKKIKLKKEKIQDLKFISEFNPDVIITTTDDKILNQKIICAAKKKRIIVYSSDNPAVSDFSNPAIVDFEKMIQIAVFTGGQSPIISKKIKEQLEKVLKKIITKKEINQLKIQKIARNLAKEKISTQIQRKKFLHNIMSDNEIDQLIKDGQVKKAEKRAKTILRNWK